ncbi:MAG: Rpn family recombination-promoting nuclease/putative transposase [Bacteroidota bacterium]|nr:Rpn family recombination-promoting nuclease/putative transposase [Bacteroidota bacterium]
MKAKYINPFTDFGFKKIFGEEASKPLLIDFLNSILPQAHQIKELSFKNSEQLGTLEIDRKAIFDIYCESNSGEKFIVELQKAKQNYFKERTIFYSTFPIREQAEKGNWNFKLAAVYCVGILDFTFDDYETEPQKSEVLHTIKLKNQNGNIFYDKLTYIYLEMPNFKLEEHELKTKMDKWLFFIKHLEDFQSIPQIFMDSVFENAFQKAELAGFNQTQMDAYEESLKHYRDLKNVIDTAFDDGKLEGIEVGILKGIEEGILKGIEEGKLKGIEEGKLKGIEEGKLKGIEEGKLKGIEEGKLKGIEEGKIETARKAKEMGLSIADIILLTGLSEAEITAL